MAACEECADTGELDEVVLAIVAECILVYFVAPVGEEVVVVPIY